jgi:hypothetical protein
MRSFIIAMGILLGIICMIVGSYITLRHLSHQNVEKMQGVYDMVIRDDWRGAESAYQSQMKEWGRHKRVFTIFLEHSEMDAIEFCLITAGESIKTTNKHDTLDAVSRSIFLFSHIEERNRFSYENVL